MRTVRLGHRMAVPGARHRAQGQWHVASGLSKCACSLAHQASFYFSYARPLARSP